MSDRVGNRRFLSRFQLQALTPPLDATIAVTSDPEDITPPKLDSISVTPACTDPPVPGACVDATSQDQVVTVKATITDPAPPGQASSGVAGGYLSYSSPSSIQSAFVFLQHTTGDQFEGTTTIHKFAEAGHWRASVTVYDRTSNYAFISDPTKVADAGIGVSKTNTCAVVNPGDPAGCATGTTPSPIDPVVSALTIPSGGTGGQVNLRITPRTTATPPSFYLLDQQLDIQAPTQADTSHPLKIVFKIDTSVLNPSDPQVQLPPGCTPGSLPSVCPFTVFKNGNRVNPCTAVPPGAIAPDPCIVDPQEQQGNTRVITVYSTSASSWNFGVSLNQNHPPDCSRVGADTKLLLPSNHKYRLISLSGATDPDADAVTLTVTGVTQDERLNGLGDGDTSPDAKKASASNQVYLRSERSGLGDGRIYRISFTGSDGKGGTCSGTVTVGVPHDQGKHSVLKDSGGTFNSFGS